MSPSSEFRFAQQVLSEWHKLQRYKSGKPCLVDGRSLDLAALVAVGKYGSLVTLSTDKVFREKLDASIDVLNKHLEDGRPVYGVTTGFGGSATTRTTNTADLQRALIQHQSSGVLAGLDVGRQPAETADDFETRFDTQAMPTSWVRASMLVRCNSLARGHSAVRVEIVQNLLSLLLHEITPVIPLRGSISASGDLSPLSYVAATLEGNPDVHVRIGRGIGTIKTAKEALASVPIEPVVLRAKEGLGLLNGTAVSAATAALALYQTQEIAILAQILTAMSVEALMGTAESFDPAISQARPHPGQIEAAATIFSFLERSSLASEVPKEYADLPKPRNYKSGLYQDRYALRTSPQWIGPQLEDLGHAYEQLSIELNSTTDNPLIDSATHRVLNGGNFQAAVVTSVMDRTRLALDKFGRMLFAQTTEMINPAFSNGLPANLTDDDPALSYTCKGIDINIASYASELSFLANPVGSHVMSAEMHNQSLNSLALISSRYTLQAVDVSRMMCAACLFAVCQALDLRANHHLFWDYVSEEVALLINRCFPQLSHPQRLDMTDQVKSQIEEMWPTTTGLALAARADKTAKSAVPIVASCLVAAGLVHEPISLLTELCAKVGEILVSGHRAWPFRSVEDRLLRATSVMGMASSRMYTFVRGPRPAGLAIPFHRGLIEHPTQPAERAGLSDEEAAARRTIGTHVSTIYEAIRDGRVGDEAMQILKQSLTQHGVNGFSE